MCACTRACVCMSVSQASLPTRPCWSPVHHFLCVAGSKLEMPISLCAARPSRRSPSPSTAHLARAAMNKFLPLPPFLPSFIHFFPSNLPHSLLIPSYCLPPSSPSVLPSFLPYSLLHWTVAVTHLLLCLFQQLWIYSCISVQTR